MINKYPQVSFIYNRRHIAAPERKAAVELRINYNRKQKFISTGIMLYPNQWRNGIIINCPDALEISQTLDTLLSEVRQIILDMIRSNDIDINRIPDMLRRNKTSHISFIEYCKERIKVRKYGLTPDSQVRYERFIRFFSLWGGIKSFDDINDANIIDYDKYLSSRGLKRSSIWNNYHRFLNSFILDAIDDGYLTKNPYQWVNIERRRIDSINKCLTPEEFRKLKNTPMPTQSLERVRDVFVFQTYTCLSYSDLCRFDARNVQELKGMKVYIDHRQKTKVEFTLPILSPAWDILMKYDGKLPIISNVKYNLFLKSIAQTAGIDKPLSTHWARHTGATLLINEGVDTKIIKKICGHSSVRITEQIYAKLLDETVVDAVQDLDI
jgi:site-specific recombinase XerD